MTTGVFQLMRTMNKAAGTKSVVLVVKRPPECTTFMIEVIFSPSALRRIVLAFKYHGRRVVDISLQVLSLYVASFHTTVTRMSINDVQATMADKQ